MERVQKGQRKIEEGIEEREEREGVKGVSVGSTWPVQI